MVDHVSEPDELGFSSHTLAALQEFLSDRGVEVEASGDEAEIKAGVASLVAAGSCGGRADDSEDDEEQRTIAHDAYVRKDLRKCTELGQPRLLTLSLVGEHHSLWGHKLWNASVVVADMVDLQEIDVKDKSVLELGAGAALPSLLAGICGARCVVATDYAIDTDTHLVDNIRENLLRYTQKEGEAEERKESTWAGVAPGIMHAEGHVWGQEVQQLLKHASAASAEGSQACEEAEEIVAPCPGFDIVFMCDLVFNRSEHEKLLLTLARTLDKDGVCYVTYSHHDPSKAPLDMQFFELAAQPGPKGRPPFRVEQVKMWQMVDIFLEHDGLDEERGKVFLATLRR